MKETSAALCIYPQLAAFPRLSAIRPGRPGKSTADYGAADLQENFKLAEFAVPFLSLSLVLPSYPPPFPFGVLHESLTET